mmetsp:Transcript_5272/g.8949  ORF Transcript_5272/g.8949 Transcript_5272/m.8949 type:complete len:282 (-) Transcript_5272:117-962(-)
MNLVHITFAAGAISKYDALTSSHPHLATSLVSLSTYTAAELVRQSLIGKKPKSSISSKQPSSIDSIARGGGGLHLRQGLTGILLMGLLGFSLHWPWICFWFQCLETIFPRRSPVDILAKIVLDQAIGCPIYYVLLGMATGLADGHGVVGTSHRVKKDMWKAVRLSWMAWPLLHAVNFSFVPMARRKLLIQAGGLAWAIFLCKLTAKQDTTIVDHMELLAEDSQRLRTETCNLSPDILAHHDNVGVDGPMGVEHKSYAEEEEEDIDDDHGHMQTRQRRRISS